MGNNSLKFITMKTKENKSTIENKKIIENHKIIAAHFEEAAKKHREAAAFYESGYHDKACSSLTKAHTHLTLATEAQTEMLKHPIFTS